MLSGKLVHLIEAHWEEALSRIIAQINRDPSMATYRAVIEPELREWGEILLRNLGHWLAPERESEIGHNYERLGRLRFEAGIPLHECVRWLAVAREIILDFVEEHVYSKTSLELYEEEELDRRLGHFFDILTIHMVKGYEEALRGAQSMRAGVMTP
jgi:hypothetical protein